MPVTVARELNENLTKNAPDKERFAASISAGVFNVNSIFQYFASILYSRYAAVN